MLHIYITYSNIYITFYILHSEKNMFPLTLSQVAVDLFVTARGSDVKSPIAPDVLVQTAIIVRVCPSGQEEQPQK